MKIINPADIAKPASKYAQGVVHKASGERLVVAGQIGVNPDGSIEKGLKAQMERAWENVFGVLRGAGFEKKHLVRVIIYCTLPGQVGLYREMRDGKLDGHLCANTYVQVAGLATPDFLVEIEAEAVKE